jgi:Transposase DDE domain group 1
MQQVAQEKLQFSELADRRVECDFSGGTLSSDGGLILLRDLDNKLNLSHRLADCFIDMRNQRFVEHSIHELVAQRLLGLCAGYEDLNDHNYLRLDPLIAVAVGKTDPTGNDRIGQDKGKALAAASTLNRLELGNQQGSPHYRKIKPQPAMMESLLIKMGVETLSPDTAEVVLDFDATDDIIHGLQEGRFFNAYYDNYCYLPLYCFVGDVPLWAQLRSSDMDASKGTVEALQKIVPVIRKRCPNARIIVRADSGFCREEIMAWCEANDVFYCFGLAKNARLLNNLDSVMFRARLKACLTGGYAREFGEFLYQTRSSWSRERRVIGKAEIRPKGENPRFIVTNLPMNGFNPEQVDRFTAAACYEELYCARGDMENRIKEQQLDLFADRTSTHFLESNQLRLHLSTFAYFLMERLRALALNGTQMAQATAGTIRLRIIKIAANVSISVRRIYIRFASAFPLKEIFSLAHKRIMNLASSIT